MAFSSGARQALGDALSWLVAGACIAAAIIYFQDLKKVAADLLGLPDPAQIEAARDSAPGSNARRRNSVSQKQRSLSGSRVEIQAGRGGHFFADARINGYDYEVLVDTGATVVSLSDEAAREAGIFLSPSDYTGRAHTANGIARVAPVNLDSVSIGDITVYDVQAVVHEPGALSTKTLLGMSFLSKLSSVAIAKGRLILEE